MKVQIGNQRGALFVELAVVLPLSTLALFFALWFSLYVQGRAVLTSAVSNAVRLAGSRSEASLLGSSEGLIQAVNSYLAGGNFDYLQPYLVVGGIDGAKAKERLESEFVQSFDESMYQVLSAPGGAKYIYALIYAVQEVKFGLGNGAVRSPCDPQSTDLDGGAGCLDCRILSPQDLAEDFVQLGEEFGLECSFAPDIGLLGGVQRLLSSVSGIDQGTVRSSSAWVITRRKIIDPDFISTSGGFFRG